MENNNRYDLGISTIKKMVSNEALENIEQMKTISPDFWEMIISFGYGDLYSREGLSNTKRVIVTLTSLITQGAFEQLEFHIRAALNVGLTKDEIKEIIIHCSGYVGFPKACQAMMIAGKVFEEVTEE
ncbi:carboxymuconolactone decarboxylase family protein [Bacillus sp. RG28]|uniref:Carboxymuconolactone decarboxylase family protein n=1 Tax=Gottfriedia endophytica TaxID=2820819 RepID=A0A940NW90_9BACI|nr:carboxymuconolactone decarboxylase family protein [Gottfriedia endophytica]MBP0726103.1 carboxymuconolactone decarboxylase family protein [Gottfriedia endophytica]